MPTKKENNSTAPGPMAGYTFQFYRALKWLSEGTAGTTVAIEKIDDISVVEADGSLIFEQDKHSISKNYYNPLSDKSKALWNTLNIWLRLIKEKGIDLSSSKFFLVTNQHVPADCLISQISEANDNKVRMNKCVEDIRSISDIPQTIQPLVDNVRSFSDNDIMELLRRIELVSQDSSIEGTKLRSEIIKNFRIPTSISDESEELFQEMLGWLVDTAMRAWHNKKAAVMDGQAFINALDNAKRARERSKTLERSAESIEVPEGESFKYRESTFVEQMKLITDNENEIDDTIDDFIRVGIELFRLSDEGELSTAHIQDLEDRLIDRWSSVRHRCIRIHRQKNESDIGYMIFDETIGNYLATLNGMATQHAYFTRGSYHRLSDNLRVGWHPKYKELLSSV